jgi:hypothetical protein
MQMFLKSAWYAMVPWSIGEHRAGGAAVLNRASGARWFHVIPDRRAGSAAVLKVHVVPDGSMF